MFFKLIYFDIKNGLLKEKIKIIFIPFIFIILCIVVYLTHSQYGEVNTFGEYWLYIVGGMKEYIPSKFESFKFPIIWFFIMIYLSYMTLYYPYNDLIGYGQNVLVRSSGRSRWWLSKCVWNTLSVVAYFLIGITIVLVFCLAFDMKINLNISPYMYENVFHINDDICLYPQSISYELLLMPILTAITISQIQMLLSLWIRPLYSFVTTVCILLASSYYVKPYMIGNFAMATRFDTVITNGVSISDGLIILLSIIVITVLIGAISFRHYDIINKEN